MSETSKESVDPPVPGKLCFVVSPIGEPGSPARIHADFVLEMIIKAAMSDYPDYRVKRADHDNRPGQIDVQMINDLHGADLVIANLSLRNPNVFYEVGICHMLPGKKIIHLQLASEERVFDVIGARSVRFALNTWQAMQDARSELQLQLKEVFAPDYIPSNPVTNARVSLAIDQSATASDKVLKRAIEDLTARVDRLDDETKRQEIAAMIDRNFTANGVGAITGQSLRDALIALLNRGAPRDYSYLSSAGSNAADTVQQIYSYRQRDMVAAVSSGTTDALGPLTLREIKPSADSTGSSPDD